MKCDVCRGTLDIKNIGYVKSLPKGRRVSECRRCHSAKRAGKEKKLSSSWMVVA